MINNQLAYLSIAETSYSEGVGFGQVKLLVDGVAANETLSENPPLDKCGKPVTSFQGSATLKVTDISPAG